MSKKFKNYVLWLGLLSAFVAAFIYLSMANIEADDSVVYLEFDNSIPMDDDRIKEVMEPIEANEDQPDNQPIQRVFLSRHIYETNGQYEVQVTVSSDETSVTSEPLNIRLP